MDAAFTEALKEVVGERYDDLPDKVRTLMHDLWVRARIEVVEPDIPLSRNLSLGELREVRDTLFKYLDEVEALNPPYPTDEHELGLPHDHPAVKVWNEKQAEYQRNTQEEFGHFDQNSIPVVAPIHESVFADAAGILEQFNSEPLLWILNPRDFVDIQKIHIERHASGDVELLYEDSPVVAKLWGIPVIKSTKLWCGTGYLVGCHADPIQPDKRTYEMLNGRHLRFVTMSVTR
jgi:hypothetical protein